MPRYSTFHFRPWSWNHHAGKISLKYALDSSVTFEELVLLPESVPDERLKTHGFEIDRMLHALHLIGGVSYFKTYIPRCISIDSGETLSRAEAVFWNTVYEQGLGEFFFRNAIDFRGLMKFPFGKKEKLEVPLTMLKPLRKKPFKERRVLVPIGGGKDSLVTVELLRAQGMSVTLLRLENHPIIEDLRDVIGLPMLTVRRSLSGNLHKLNAAGALNGHIPITAYLSILSVLIALLYDYDAVVMSNEASASEGNVSFQGMEINHQWSKSLTFEKMFQEYLKKTVDTHVEYFSLLRPMTELRVTQEFSKHPKYFMTATSCNKNWKILEEGRLEEGKWCGTCPKCAFVFLMLAAFTTEKKLRDMFGKNLLDQEEILPLFRELLGLQKWKPFECVGTKEECIAAFLLARKKSGFSKTKAVKMFEHEVLPALKDETGIIEHELQISRPHSIPKEYCHFLPENS